MKGQNGSNSFGSPSPVETIVRVAHFLEDDILSAIPQAKNVIQQHVWFQSTIPTGKQAI